MSHPAESVRRVVQPARRRRRSRFRPANGARVAPRPREHHSVAFEGPAALARARAACRTTLLLRRHAFSEGRVRQERFATGRFLFARESHADAPCAKPSAAWRTPNCEVGAGAPVMRLLLSPVALRPRLERAEPRFLSAGTASLDARRNGTSPGTSGSEPLPELRASCSGRDGCTNSRRVRYEP